MGHPGPTAIGRREITRAFGSHGFEDFQFSSFSTELNRDWLGDSFAFTVNFRLRQLLLAVSKVALPPLSRGNIILSTFRRGDDKTASGRGSQSG